MGKLLLWTGLAVVVGGLGLLFLLPCQGGHGDGAVTEP
jgi:hypothetical protein